MRSNQCHEAAIHLAASHTLQAYEGGLPATSTHIAVITLLPRKDLIPAPVRTPPKKRWVLYTIEALPFHQCRLSGWFTTTAEKRLFNQVAEHVRQSHGGGKTPQMMVITRYCNGFRDDGTALWSTFCHHYRVPTTSFVPEWKYIVQQVILNIDMSNVGNGRVA